MNNNNGIPIYELFIQPEDVKKLKRDIWSEELHPAILLTQKKKMDIGIRFRGSHIRKFTKKSYNMFFKNPKTFNRAKELHLNAEYKDPSLLRNKLSFDFFSEIGCLAPRSRHVLLKLNGRVEGVYLEIEAVDHYFLSNRSLPDGSIYYAINGDANFSLMSELDKEAKQSLDSGYERKLGPAEHDFFLQQLIFKINTVSNAHFEQEIMKYLNIEQYLKWIAGVVLTQNYDGFVHNYALYRNAETDLFEVIPWDYDATWGRDVNGKFMDADYVRIEGFNTLTARLLSVENFRKKYKAFLLSCMEHYFSLEFMKPKIETLHESLRPYVLIDPYKKNQIDMFDQEPKFICTYIEERKKYLSSQLTKLE